MKKVLLILALLMPVFIVSSCADKDEDEYETRDITKEELIGTWVIIPETKRYTRIEIVFKDDFFFGMKIDRETTLENGDIIHSQNQTGGYYTVEKNKVSFGENYLKIDRHSKGNKIEGVIDLGFGAFHYIANKQ